MDFGLIFHWGVYSAPAYDDPVSASKRQIQNGSEWYLQRLLETGNYRPISGWKETQQYHEQFQGLSYKDFADYFVENDWNPDEWMKLALHVNAKYVILTAKHHDGFCLWDTKSSNFNSVQVGPKRDLLKEFSLSAKKYGLNFGIYYSWMEFEKNCTIEYMKNVIKPQISELISYEPDIWWFDGDWKCSSQFSKKLISEIVSHLKVINPKVEINDRICLENKDSNYLGLSTYRVYSDRHIPHDVPNVPWEHINTIGLSWGYNHFQRKQDYKSGADLYDLYKQVREKGGRFLLNLGPDRNGELDPDEVQSLMEFSELAKHNILN